MVTARFRTSTQDPAATQVHWLPRPATQNCPKPGLATPLPNLPHTPQLDHAQTSPQPAQTRPAKPAPLPTPGPRPAETQPCQTNPATKLPKPDHAKPTPLPTPSPYTPGPPAPAHPGRRNSPTRINHRRRTPTPPHRLPSRNDLPVRTELQPRSHPNIRTDLDSRIQPTGVPNRELVTKRRQP